MDEDGKATEVSGTAEEIKYLGRWPYREVSSLNDVAALGGWLNWQGRQEESDPLGIALREGVWTFATKGSGWLVVLTDENRELLHQTIKLNLIEGTNPPIIALRDMALDIPEIVLRLSLGAEDELQLLKRVSVDISILSYATGIPGARSGNMNALTDALDISTVGVQMSVEPGGYYRNVGLPLGRMKLARPVAGERRWSVTYDYLLLRVLAHYTGDPLMARWFTDDKDPWLELKDLLELDDDPAMALIAWVACAMDEDVLRQRSEEYYENLPTNPRLLLATHIDKNLPTLRIGIDALLARYQTAPHTAKTLYQRRVVMGASPAQAGAHHLWGSVEDIVSVALVSFGNLGGTGITSMDSSNPQWMRATIMGYTNKETIPWERELKSMATLGEPLRTALSSTMISPKVMVS